MKTIYNVYHEMIKGTVNYVYGIKNIDIPSLKSLEQQYGAAWRTWDVANTKRFKKRIFILQAVEREMESMKPEDPSKANVEQAIRRLQLVVDESGMTLNRYLDDTLGYKKNGGGEKRVLSVKSLKYL
jgi:Zn-finger domain-containing protein